MHRQRGIETAAFCHWAVAAAVPADNRQPVREPQGLERVATAAGRDGAIRVAGERRAGHAGRIVQPLAAEDQRDSEAGGGMIGSVRPHPAGVRQPLTRSGRAWQY